MGGKFTPGPWTLTHKAGTNFAIQTFEIRGTFGGKPDIYPIFNRNTDAIDGGLIHTSPENARLIASAPTLYDAAQALIARLDELQPERSERPTVAQLEAILAANPGSVEMKPDGSIHIMPREEIEALRAALALAREWPLPEPPEAGEGM